MGTKGRSAHIHHYRNRLKWKIRNNYVFFIIIVIIGAIAALLVGIEIYNFEKVKSMEAILDKTYRTIHKKTGITDQDVQKLKEVYPDFNWETTWDRERWQEGTEERRDRLQREKARESYQFREKERLRQLEARERKTRGY